MSKRLRVKKINEKNLKKFSLAIENNSSSYLVLRRNDGNRVKKKVK